MSLELVELEDVGSTNMVPSVRVFRAPASTLSRDIRGMRDFFISYSGSDHAWAEWIAWTLEEAEYAVFIQAWDFRPGESFPLEMQHALENSRATIALLSQNYLEASYTHSEWAAAFATDPNGKSRALIPVRIGQCELKGLYSTIIYADLLGKSEERARTTLLDALRKRAKPSVAPRFPGSMRSESTLTRVQPTRPSFPA